MRILKREAPERVVVLELTGKLCRGPAATPIEKEVAEIAAQGPRKVIVDLGGVSVVDSHGLGLLVSCYVKMKDAGGTLCLAGAQPMVSEILKIARIEKTIPNYPTVETALDTLSRT